MRSALIAVFVAVFGSALPAMAQTAAYEATKSVAETMAAAPRCGVTFDREAAAEALAAAGYDPTNREHVADMESWSWMARMKWSTLSGERLKIECDLLWQSFGPDGLVRKGLLRK